MGQLKSCKNCKEEKLLNAFYKDHKNIDGLKKECIMCYKWRQYISDKANYKEKKFYSWGKQGIIFLDIGHFENVYEYYINLDRCDCCGKKFKSTKDRHLEHLHVNIANNIRGIVCQRCNIKLGATDRLRDKMHLELHRYFNCK